MVNQRAPVQPSQETTNFDQGKNRLVERKQQQWKQEIEKTTNSNPFVRPTAAPTTVLPDPNVSLNDQSRIPAAMRTNLLFGDVRFEDDVKTAKEVERQRWLDDLRRQIDENKRKKYSQEENERRQEIVQENLLSTRENPPVSNIFQTQTTTTPSSAPAAPPETNRSTQHDSLVQQTYQKILEAAEKAKYEKKAQLIEKLKRNGHKTELLAKTLPGKSFLPKHDLFRSKVYTTVRTRLRRCNEP